MRGSAGRDGIRGRCRRGSPPNRNLRRHRWFTGLALTVLCLGLLAGGPGAQAGGPRRATLYGPNGPLAYLPPPYRVTEWRSGASLGVGPLQAPQGLWYQARTRTLYIADTGGNRVVAVPPSGAARVIGASGPQALRGPTGVATYDGFLLVADPSQGRIAVYTASGVYLRNLRLHSVVYASTHITFAPEQIAVGRLGVVYAINRSTYQGLLAFTLAGHFLGFTAASPPQVGPLQTLERALLTRAQRAQLVPIYPSAPGGVAVGPGGFVYVTNPYRQTDQIRRLSPVGGGNTLPGGPSTNYGYTRYEGLVPQVARFGPVAVSAHGFIAAADTNGERIFVYDPRGAALFTIGGQGTRRGRFGSLSALAAGRDGVLYALDRRLGTLQRFAPTRFGRRVRQASRLYVAGHYRQAAAGWRAVLAADATYPLALKGLGQADLASGHPRQAMTRFRAAHDRSGYQLAHAALQLRRVRAAFGWLFLAVGLAVAAIVAVWRFSGRIWAWAWDLAEQRWPWEYHPLAFVRRVGGVLGRAREEFYALKWERPVGTAETVGLMVWLFAVRVAGHLWTGFAFRPAGAAPWQPGALALETFLPLGAWTLASYGVADVLGGEGRLHEVWSSSLLCLLPYCLLGVPVALLSRALVPGDASLYGFFHLVEVVWIAWLFLQQVIVLHDFAGREVTRAVVWGSLAVVGMAFASVVVLGLSGQFGQFLHQVSRELTALGWRPL